MSGPDPLEAFYLALEESPGDRATLLALADWHDEQGDTNAATCLRWVVSRGRCPFRYRMGAIRANSPYFHDGWYWWTVEDRHGSDWGHTSECRLPRKLWQHLRHSFDFDPLVCKQYATVRDAYEVLLEAWPRAQPLERSVRPPERRW